MGKFSFHIRKILEHNDMHAYNMLLRVEMFCHFWCYTIMHIACANYLSQLLFTTIIVSVRLEMLDIELKSMNNDVNIYKFINSIVNNQEYYVDFDT